MAENRSTTFNIQVLNMYTTFDLSLNGQTDIALVFLYTLYSLYVTTILYIKYIVFFSKYVT